jgi:hypothetical protein
MFERLGKIMIRSKRVLIGGKCVCGYLFVVCMCMCIV